MIVAGVRAATLQPEKPVLVVFDFESAHDRGRIGRKVTEMFRGHAFRRGAFITIDPATFEEMLAEAGGAKVTLATDPATVSKLTQELFGGHIAIWGRVERLAADNYRVHVRILDRRKDPAALVVDKAVSSTLHGMFYTVDDALDALLGTKRPEKRDIYKDLSWRRRTNLVKNGNFEQGDATPLAWERVDGLCTFWVKNPDGQGKCAMMDTHVLQTQYEKWLTVFNLGASARSAPKPIRPKLPAYGAVGGGIGAHLYSDPVPIKQGMAYRVDLDFRSRGGTTKVFVKGYAPFYRKDGSVDHREVYRAQIELYPKTNAREWEHAARIIHPSQPFALLTIRSDFDRGKTGDRLRELLAKRLVEKGVSPMRDLEDTRRKLKGHEHVLTFKGSKYPVTQMVQNVFKRAVVVWGEIGRQDDGGLEVRLRSLDVRENAGTKDWWHTLKIAPRDLDTAGEPLAQAILVNARLVTFLRVKLDAYYPVGKYYFDNVCITEEPADKE